MERKTNNKKRNPAKSHRLNQKQRKIKQRIANFTKNTHETLISKSFTTRACRGEKRRETRATAAREREERKKWRKYEGSEEGHIYTYKRREFRGSVMI
jgi:hypothetical protein